jgi:hypothetical protein
LAFSKLLFHPIGKNANFTENKNTRWQKTAVANLVCQVRTGRHYARIRLGGKLI